MLDDHNFCPGVVGLQSVEAHLDLEVEKQFDRCLVNLVSGRAK